MVCWNEIYSGNEAESGVHVLMQRGHGHITSAGAIRLALNAWCVPFPSLLRWERPYSGTQQCGCGSVVTVTFKVHPGTFAGLLLTLRLGRLATDTWKHLRLNFPQIAWIKSSILESTRPDNNSWELMESGRCWTSKSSSERRPRTDWGHMGHYSD